MPHNDQEFFEFNGLDASTGRPLLRLSSEEALKVARGERVQPAYFEQLRDHWEAVRDRPFAVAHGVDPSKLEETGWGVIWAHGLDPAIREALEPLLSLRKKQAGNLYKELTYRPQEPTLDFMARHGVGPGPVDPRRIPYYLLLVGSPEQIPFEFHYKLDVQYGVGRLSLEGPEDYARYAQGVVGAESGAVRRPRKVSLFGVSNQNDSATLRSRTDLVEPLEAMAEDFGGWRFELMAGEDAKKAKLSRVLGGAETPALLFFAGHGLGYPNGHEQQKDRQGALVCQDWGGPDSSNRGVTPAESFAASDLPDEADPGGLIAFLFACFGAGTPRREDFFDGEDGPEFLAPEPFVAKLPQRLLGRPGGTALAVIGHVERAWTYSFLWPQAGAQLQVFESALGRLLDGFPVGAAMEYFGQRFAELAVFMQAAHEDLKYEPSPNVISIAGTSFAFKDARSYVVLGDPAVRLAVDTSETLRAPGS